jgi:hypothetical protein
MRFSQAHLGRRQHGLSCNFSLPAAFCVWRTWLISRSIVSAVMKQTFGVKPAGSYSCWMLWTAGSHKKEKIGFGTDAAPHLHLGEERFTVEVLQMR